MANITKIVNTTIDPSERSQFWDSATHLNDAAGAIAAGDIFQIFTSLGRAAKKIKITTSGGTMSFRKNSQYSLIPEGKWKYDNTGATTPIMNEIQTAMDITMNPIVLQTGVTYEFSGAPVSNIEIVTKVGQFTLEVS